MLNLLRTALIAIALSGVSMAAKAQSAQVAFGGLQHDSSLPVEVVADQLQVNQTDGSAVFTGNVVIGQGTMRLSAAEVQVEYTSAESGAAGRISRMLASGGVVLVNGGEAAEANEATYTIDTGSIVMTGDVVMTQGQNALTANRMVIDLNTGTANMEGRVRTILQSGSNN